LICTKELTHATHTHNSFLCCHSFEKLGNETIEMLLADLSLLIPIITNHVIPGVIPSVALTDGASVTAVGGLNITASIVGETIMFNEATVVTKDVLASNGIVHGIDTVLGLELDGTFGPSMSVAPVEAAAPPIAPIQPPIDPAARAHSYRSS